MLLLLLLQLQLLLGRAELESLWHGLRSRLGIGLVVTGIVVVLTQDFRNETGFQFGFDPFHVLDNSAHEHPLQHFVFQDGAGELKALDVEVVGISQGLHLLCNPIQKLSVSVSLTFARPQLNPLARQVVWKMAKTTVVAVCAPLGGSKEKTRLANSARMSDPIRGLLLLDFPPLRAPSTFLPGSLVFFFLVVVLVVLGISTILRHFRLVEIFLFLKTLLQGLGDASAAHGQVVRRRVVLIEG
mmetsp:Transcript_1406/g.3120  ORF Transcript_1406/g.3120 Transcript_1406/m.3120 type:complete len:242 (-) Transcript_1406:489-1214(-)